jgi:hypothetical protein
MDDIIHRPRTIGISIGTRISPPIIRKGKKDIWAFLEISRFQRGAANHKTLTTKTTDEIQPDINLGENSHIHMTS